MPDVIRTYSLSNKARDLGPALHTVIEKFGGFLALFKPAAKATNHKHEWHQDRIGGRGFAVTAYSSSKATLSAADYAKVRVGTLFRVKGYPVVFIVTELCDDNKIKASVHAANGNNDKTALAANDECLIIGTPVKPGSKLGEGDDTHRTIGTGYNYTQIVRKDTGLTNSDMATLTTDGVENSIARQTEHAVDEARRDLAHAAIWGVRTERDLANNVYGEAGGIYCFTADGMTVDADGARLSSKLVNDAALKITAAGGTPTVVVCTPAQARVLGNEYKDKVTVMRDDKVRGVYVAVVANEADGSGIRIIGDPGFDDGDAFVADEECFGLSVMRPLHDEDSTTKGTDGISRMVLGEFTFEFRNAGERICRIKNLQSPDAALAAIQNDARNVNVSASSMGVSTESVVITSGAVVTSGGAV